MEMDKDLKQNGPAPLLSQTLLEEILEPNLDEIAKNIDCSYEVCHFGCGYGSCGGHGSYGLDRGCGGGCLPGCGPCGWQPCCNQFCLDQYWGFYDPTDPHKQFRMIGGIPDGLIRCFCKPGETKPEPEEDKDIVVVEEKKKKDKMLAKIKAEKEAEQGEEGGSLTDISKSKTSGSAVGAGGSGTSSTGATLSGSGQFTSTFGTYMMRSGPQNKYGQKALKEALERMGLADKEKEINDLIDLNNNLPINQNKTLQGKPIYYKSPESESETMTKRISKYAMSNYLKKSKAPTTTINQTPATKTEDSHPYDEDYLELESRPNINTSHQVLQYLNSLPENPDNPDTHDDEFVEDFNRNYLYSSIMDREIAENKVKKYDSPLDWDTERSRNWNIYKAQRIESPLLGGQDEYNYESRQSKINSRFRQNLELTTIALEKSTRNHSMLTRLGQGRKNLNHSRTLTPINTRARAGCCGGQARSKPKSRPKSPKNYQKNDPNGNERKIQELEYALRTLPIQPGQTRSFAVQPRTLTYNYKSKPKSSGYGQKFTKPCCGCDGLTLKRIQKNFP